MRYGRVALVISYVGGNMNKFLALILTSVLVLSIFSITPIYATSVTENGDAGSSLADRITLMIGTWICIKYISMTRQPFRPQH